MMDTRISFDNGETWLDIPAEYPEIERTFNVAMEYYSRALNILRPQPVTMIGTGSARGMRELYKMMGWRFPAPHRHMMRRKIARAFLKAAG